MKTAYTHYYQVDSSIVYEKIAELINKQEIKKTIRVDTLSLIFGMSVFQIDPFLEELEMLGKIERHVPTTQSKKSTAMGTISLP